MCLNGKVVLVTGGADGIGKATVAHFLREGAKVAFCDVNGDAGLSALHDLGSRFKKGSALFFQADVCSANQLKAVFDGITEKWNRLDFVINSAGVVDETNWEKTIETNLIGVIRCSYMAVDVMRKDRGGSGGTVINIGSIVTFFPSGLLPAYSTTKSAVVAFSRCMSDPVHLEVTGVRFMAICPGKVDTNLGHGRGVWGEGHQFSQMVEDMSNSMAPMMPTEVAAAILKLATEGQNGAVWRIEHGSPVRNAKFALLADEEA